MSETETEAQGQRAKISGLAIASLVLSLFPFALAFHAFTSGTLTSDVLSGYFVLAPLSLVVAVMLGIAALIQRMFRTYRWWWLAFAGIVISGAWFITVCIWIMGVAGSWH